MARKARKRIDRKITAERTLEDIKTAKVSEYCYFVDYWNKIRWGQIHNIINENDKILLATICQAEYKYYVVPVEYCSFNEKSLKGVKRK